MVTSNEKVHTAQYEEVQQHIVTKFLEHPYQKKGQKVAYVMPLLGKNIPVFSQLQIFTTAALVPPEMIMITSMVTKGSQTMTT
jgi:hypothetical protein